MEGWDRKGGMVSHKKVGKGRPNVISKFNDHCTFISVSERCYRLSLERGNDIFVWVITTRTYFGTTYVSFFQHTFIVSRIRVYSNAMLARLAGGWISRSQRRGPS